MAERNIIRNILKNFSWWNILWVLPYYMLINLAEFIALTLTGQFSSATDSYINAYIWNIKNLKSTLRKRKGIQRVRTKSDFQVMKSMFFIPHKFLALLELGIPKVNKGINAACAEALLADSGPATPSITPVPNFSGCLDTFFSKV